VVWLAQDQLVGRQVAVKELRPPTGLTDDERETYRRRALHEARSAARIHHPGAVLLYDVLPATSSDDALYLIMELVPGPTLAELIRRSGPLPAAAVAAYGLQLLPVLEAAHALGIVHRDVKPANIIIAPGGQAKLTDFGIAHAVGEARLTSSGFMGTQAYTAPELFDAGPITPAADLWSLGATLFAAAEGHGPFDRETAGATLRAILLDDLPAPHCAPPLAAAILGLLQRDPARRATARQARAQLLQADATRAPWEQAATTRSPSPPPVLVPQPAPAPAPGRPSHRRRLLVIAAVAAAVAITASVVPFLMLSGARQTLAATLADPGGSNASATVNSVAFSPDGRTLAVGDQDHSAYLWDLATRRIVATLTAPVGSASVSSVAFSPGGTTLAAGDGDGSTFLWDLATGRLAATLADPPAASGGSSEGVNAVAFSPDGKLLAAADADDSTYLWDVATRQVTATLTDPSGLASQMKAVGFSPDGTMLATADADGKTYLWSVATGRLAATLSDPGGESVSSVAFSPHGTMLATGDGDGSTYLWDVAAGRLAATLTGPDSSLVSSVAFSPDGKTVAAGAGGGSTYLWDVATGQPAATLTDPQRPAGNPEGVNAVAFSPDGTMLAAGDADDSTYLWHIG
jgi:Tol biopolymer transport system component/tRNA A-37 threonylcarbamoyl transferase component Bud32